jgi:hypothetical protein
MVARGTARRVGAQASETREEGNCVTQGQRSAAHSVAPPLVQTGQKTIMWLAHVAE